MVVQQPHGQPAEHTPLGIEISVYHQQYRFLLSNASENQLIFDEYSTYLNTKVKNIFQIKNKNNGSQLKNPDISGAILKLSLSILILDSPCHIDNV